MIRKIRSTFTADLLRDRPINANLAPLPSQLYQVFDRRILRMEGITHRVAQDGILKSNTTTRSRFGTTVSFTFS